MGTFLILLLIVAVVYLATRDTDNGRRPEIRNAMKTPKPPKTPGLTISVVLSGEAGSPISPAKTARSVSSASPTKSRAYTSERMWIPPGTAVNIAGHLIPGGMIYVGDSLRAANDWSNEPALINPNLKVAPDHARVAAPDLGYWPSYSAIQPSNRAVYLQWLANGRFDPQIGIGYVFLFFYGLERRALFDAKHIAAARAELPLIAEEIERLLDLYGQHNSFAGYAGRFLGYIKCQDELIDVTNAVPPTARSSWDLPMEVKFAIGKYVQQEKPIPAEWALAWFRLDPRAGLRTAGVRCPEEMTELFMFRYRERFGDGMVLKRNKTNLRVEYHAASSSLHGVQLDYTIDLPDVTRLEGPLNKLRKLGDDVQQELDRFSRWVGRTGDRTSPSAIALLPAPIVQARLTGDTAELLATVKGSLNNSDVSVLKTIEILRYWPVKDMRKVTKAEAVGLSDLLSNLGYGIEPDVRFGGVTIAKSDKLAVFKLERNAPAPTKEFESARLLLHLGAAIATADKEVTPREQTSLEEHLQRSLRLSDVERTRLHAYLRWLLAEPPSLAGLKPKLQQLTGPQRATTARFLLAIAGADGHVSTPELKMLGKIYDLLGLDSTLLYEDVHNLAVEQFEPGPVTVIPFDESVEKGYAIPRKAKDSAADEGVGLDLQRVRAVMDDTQAVTAILTGIFSEQTEQDEEVAATDDMDAPDAPIVAVASAAKLDEPHMKFLKALAAQDHWHQAELSQLAAEHGLMPAGAIEMVNQAAFAACDEPLLEGNDPAEVNRYALEEMLT